MIEVIDINITTYTPQYLQEEVFEKLKKVANKHKLILYEGYRSLEKQTEMFNKFKNEHPDLTEEECHKFVAIPEKAFHVTGKSVDVALEGKNMGTEYLCFDGRQRTDYYINEEVKENRKLLCDLMAEQGFENFYNEWWHFDYKGGELND